MSRRKRRNPFPHLANPLAAQWTEIAILTVDSCADPTDVDPQTMQWGRRAFYLGAQAALHVLARGADRQRVTAEISRELDDSDGNDDEEPPA